MNKLKSVFLGAVALLFSISSIAESDPLREFLISELTQSPDDYAAKPFTGIVFHYGKVNVDSDKLSLRDVDAIGIIMQLGRFEYNGTIHDVQGVEWILKAGLDQPHLFKRWLFPGFIFGSINKITSPYPKMQQEWTHTFKRFEYAIISEYEEKQVELLRTNVNDEVSRIIQVSKFLRLPVPTCSSLF